MSQEKKIIEHLLKHDHITMLEALGVYRIYNLKGRIADMRIKYGNKFIVTNMQVDDTGKKYARYHLNPAFIYQAEKIVYGASHAEAA